MMKTLKVKFFGFHLKHASNLIREMLDEDYDDEGVVIHGEWSNRLKVGRTAQMIKNGGVLGHMAWRRRCYCKCK